MKQPSLLPALSALVAALLLPSQPAPAAEQPPDTLILRNGSTRSGRLTGLDRTSVRLEIRVGELPPATISLPRRELREVVLAEDSEREAFIAGEEGQDILQAARWWGGHERYLAIPRTPASRIGRRYADILLRDGNLQLAKRSLDIFSQIERDAWDATERARARQGRLRAMIATGAAAGAVEEARALALETEEPELLIEAKYILATVSSEKFRDLIEENPRWMEDVFVRPERDRLFHETLDLFLFPALFFGSEAGASARGLWAASKIYLEAGEVGNAVEAARDIAELYPETREAADARDFLQQFESSDEQSNHTHDNNKLPPRGKT